MEGSLRHQGVETGPMQGAPVWTGGKEAKRRVPRHFEVSVTISFGLPAIRCRDTMSI